MSDPIKVRIPSRGVTLTFPADAKPEDIEQVIAQDYPRNGQDVAYDLAQNPSYADKMSLKEYEDLRRYKKENPATSDLIWQGLKGAVAELGAGIEKGVEAAGNLEFGKAGEAVAKGALVGAGDLGDMFNRAIVWDQAPDTYEDFLAGRSDTPERKAEYDAKLKADFKEFQNLQFWQADRKKIVESSPIPEVTQATSYVLDPSIVVPGVGEITGASKLAAKGVGMVSKGLGETARVVTKPLAQLAETAAKSENEIVRGISNLVSPASAVVRGADDIARAATVAGENLVNAPTRVGALESLGRQASPTRVDRALAAVGRYGADRAIQNALATATGAVEGAALGAALGAVAEGEEGFYSGLGTGMTLGAIGGSGGNAYYQLSGQARIDAALADFNRFRDNLDPDTRTKLDTVAERDGLDSVVRLMDGAGLLRGQFKDADVNFLSGDEFKAKHKGAEARGVQIIEAERPVIDINVDHKRSDYTFGHEIFHALEQVEQLRPQMDRIKQEIVGAWVTGPDGAVTQAQAGFLSPAEVEIRHKQYMRKLAQSGADARGWYTDRTIQQKANRVAGELGAEYMARLITGSDPDSLLRGFDGLTRRIADYTLLKASNETLRGIAASLGTDTRPVESILFKDLRDAPPVVAAALRDVLRARKGMADRIELTDRSERALVVKPTDLSNPAAAEIAVRAGVAVKDPSGAVRMRTDDELGKLEDDQANAVRKIVEATPVADVTKPHLRLVDGNIQGGGISPEQLKAFLADPTLTNKVKESLGQVAESLSNLNSGKGGNVIFIEYGPALRKTKSKLTGRWLNRYSSGIRLTQREVAPFALLFNKGDVPYIRAVDVTKLMSKAGDRASSGKLGPYGRDFDAFTADAVRYFENISNPNGVRTAELPGMTPERATFLNQFFGSQEKGAAEFVRSFRLDRVTESRLTNQRIAASELAWQRHKVNWMPAEKVGDGQVVKSTEGFSIINKGKNWHLYAPDGKRIGIYETQARAEARANDSVANALPRRSLTDTQTTTRDENGNLFYKGKAPKDWTPEDFAGFGQEHGISNLGPLSEVREVPTGLVGNPARIPGGLDGKFTYYDLLWLKANPVDVKSLPEQTHAQLTAKLARTMAPEPGDKVASFNSIVFGMLSPNAPLLPNEIGQARLRFGSMDDIRKFAALYPKNPTKENLVKLNETLKKKLGFTAAGKGGLGIPITANLANIVNAARLFVKNPDFFVKQPGESWANFVDKLTTQVPGFGTKTGSFGSVWQDPLNASISAMDRHMARIFGEELMGDKDMRQRFEGIVVDRFNKLLSDAKKTSNAFAKKIAVATDEKAKAKLEAQRNKELASLPDPSAAKAKSIDDVLGQAQIYGPERVREFVNEAVFAAMGSRKAKLINAKGDINPNAPEHLKSVQWIETPQDFQVMSEAYRSALDINERRANELGVAVFPAQWTLWDRIRQRVEPHEAMFPGLEKLPALNDAQLADAYKANKVAGYMSTPKPGKKWKRSEVASPAQLAYFMPADLPVVQQAIARRRTKKESETDITLGELMDRLDDERSYGDEYMVAAARATIKEFKQRRVPRNIVITDEARKLIEAEMLRRAELLEKEDENTVDVQATPVAPKLLFQPAQKLPNGNVWRGENGLTIVQKDGGNYRVYSPLGLLGVAASYEKAQQLVNRRAR